MFWPKKVCSHDGRSPSTYPDVFGDFSSHDDIGECHQSLARMALGGLSILLYHLKRLRNGTNGPIGARWGRSWNNGVQPKLNSLITVQISNSKLLAINFLPEYCNLLPSHCLNFLWLQAVINKSLPEIQWSHSVKIQEEKHDLFNKRSL